MVSKLLMLSLLLMIASTFFIALVSAGYVNFDGSAGNVTWVNVTGEATGSVSGSQSLNGTSSSLGISGSGSTFDANSLMAGGLLAWLVLYALPYI